MTDTTTTSETVLEIARQMAQVLRVRGLRADYLSLNENACRAHIRIGRKVHNIDITLDRAHDTYDVVATSFRTMNIAAGEQTRTWSMIYADQLGTIVEAVTGREPLGIR